MTTDYSIRGVSISLRDDVERIVGKPWGLEGPDLEGSARIAKVATPDGFVGFVGLITWPNGQRETKLVDAVGDPGEYGRLRQAGVMAMKDAGAQVAAVLKAMKFGDRGWATLANVEWRDLDELAGGDLQTLLSESGARVGQYGDFVETSAQYRARPGIAVEVESPMAIFVAYVITRVIPLMVRYGKPGVEAF